jgi:hypothetical protein
MTRFIKTTTDERINVDRIDKIARKMNKSTAFLTNGRSVTLDDNRAINKMPLRIIAATPGYMLLRYFDHVSPIKPKIERLPVIAWRVNEGYAFPITPNRPFSSIVNDNNCISTGLLLPDGQIIDSHAIHPNETDWLEAMKEVAQWPVHTKTTIHVSTTSEDPDEND